MATIDPNSQSIVKWNPGDVISEGRVGFSQIVQMLNNDNAAANLLARAFNAWSLGSDAYDHFKRDITAENWWLQKVLSNAGTITLDEDAHLLILDSSSSASSAAVVATKSRVRSDRVPSLVGVRLKNAAHAANSSPVVGLTSSTSAFITAIPNDGAWFQAGTNSNTYKARTRSGGTDRETTDNLAANFTGWDELRVEMDATEARFYIAGTLVATHTISLPVTALLYGQAGAHLVTGGQQVSRLDYFIHAAMENSLSP